MTRKRYFAPALLVLLAGCGGQDAPPPAETATASPPNAPVQSTAVAGASTAQDQESYRLTMPVVQRWQQAMRNVGETLAQDPDLADEFEATEGSGSVDGLTAHYSDMPRIRSAIERSGMEVREFVLVLVTLPHAMDAQAAIDQGADREQVVRSRRVNPANLDFVRENRAELERMQRELNELG